MCDFGRLELTVVTGQFGLRYRQVYRKVSKQASKHASKQASKHASKQTSMEVSGHGTWK